MAGRIPQSFINTLLDRVDILAVVGERVPLKRKGSSYWGCCPFHDEKSASFHVLPERQFYKCFGCGVSGTALSFVMAYEHLEFVPAIERLAASCGLEVPREAGGDPAVDREREQLLAAVAAAAEHFQATLSSPKGKGARNYLERRGIDAETSARFGIGYASSGSANSSWDGMTQALARFDDAILEKAGLLARNERGTYDRFRDRLMFPIRNRRGRVIAFGGRVLDAGEPKYLNSPETPIFQKGREVYGLHEGRRGIGRAGLIVLVEGYMDVVGLAQHGIDNAVAALGTATSAGQLELLLKSAPELVCCFDADKAGDTAAWRALETALPLLTDERRLSFVRLPPGEDPDSLVRNGGAPAWQKFIAAREAFADYFFAVLGQGLQLQRVDDRTALVQRAEPLIARLPQGVRQRLMRERLRELAGLPARGAAPAAPAYRRAARFASPRGAGAASESLADRMLTMLLHAPELAADPALDWLDTLAPEVEPVLALLAETRELFIAHPAADLGTLLGHFHGHPQQARVQAALRAGPDLPRQHWPAAFASGMANLQQREHRQVPASIDSEEALKAHFEARQRRERQENDESGAAS